MRGLRHALVTVVLALLPTGAWAQGATTFESDTVGSTSASLATTTTGIPNFGPATQCVVPVETASIRYRIDGGIPTATAGLPADPGDTIQLNNVQDIANFQFIAASSTSAVINVSCRGNTTASPSVRLKAIPLLSSGGAVFVRSGFDSSVNFTGTTNATVGTVSALSSGVDTNNRVRLNTMTPDGWQLVKTMSTATLPTLPACNPLLIAARTSCQ